MSAAAEAAKAFARPVYVYTASPFENAPEAIWRVVSQGRISNHETGLRVIPGVCTVRTGLRPFTIVVSDAGDPHFAPGAFVMTGGMTKGSRIISVIRELSASEFKRRGCERVRGS